MKSKNILIALALMFLLLAVVSSTAIWPDVASAAKIAFFAFGFSAGVTTGARMARR